ncbi:NAD(P)-dependent oxidoreductase [Vibrio sp. SCSIO 43137]|uniref:NAD(P)-dependent oxidoreductase n=1 Tax=Vibrio sp. SCSIO 43137 TaxID=3021011 RepID=UPI0023075787|nr:NAD(P)-dependent oxidoreductase [Vibrio sp. SCSIO 43137]WCE31725.1 NAD(P)-dependent oxidoreductase [Vibrio sp. SCSIO 43137]
MKIYIVDNKYRSNLNSPDIPPDVQILLAAEEDFAEIEYVVDGRMTKQHFDKMPKLKAVAIPFAGVNRMDLAQARKRGVKVVNTHIHSCFVAEKAVCLTMALLGKTLAYHLNMKSGDWSARNDPVNRVKWDSLSGKRIGIYGYGHIGRYIHKLLSPFGCEFYAIDRGEQFAGINPVEDLYQLSKACDILFVCVPISDETYGAVDKEILANLANKYLINVARGDIIVEEDLYNALNNEQLKGFASDVWYNYPVNENSSCLPSRFPIHQCDNVILSPHSATATYDAHRLMFNDAVNKLIKLNRGDNVKLINLEAGILTDNSNVAALG